MRDGDCAEEKCSETAGPEGEHRLGGEKNQGVEEHGALITGNYGCLQ